jgi:hypothetical protein
MIDPSIHNFPIIVYMRKIMKKQQRKEEKRFLLSFSFFLFVAESSSSTHPTHPRRMADFMSFMFPGRQGGGTFEQEYTVYSMMMMPGRSRVDADLGGKSRFCQQPNEMNRKTKGQ